MKDPKDNKTIDAFEKKPMTSAERQRKYRENQKKDYNKGTSRLDMQIANYESYCLKQLAKLHGNTQKEMLEMLIKNEVEKQGWKITDEDIEARKTICGAVSL